MFNFTDKISLFYKNIPTATPTDVFRYLNLKNQKLDCLSIVCKINFPDTILSPFL